MQQRRVVNNWTNSPQKFQNFFFFFFKRAVLWSQYRKYSYLALLNHLFIYPFLICYTWSPLRIKPICFNTTILVNWFTKRRWAATLIRVCHISWGKKMRVCFLVRNETLHQFLIRCSINVEKKNVSQETWCFLSRKTTIWQARFPHILLQCNKNQISLSNIFALCSVPKP